MNLLILFFGIIFLIEIIERSNYISLINLIIQLTLKSSQVILSESISDHWKEKIILKYSLRMIRISLSIILITFLIASLFFITNYFLGDFFKFIFSFKGIIASIFFGFGYIYLKK